jgi:hypothetical protein
MQVTVNHDGATWTPVKSPLALITVTAIAFGVGLGSGISAALLVNVAVGAACAAVGIVSVLAAGMPAAARQERIELRPDRVWVQRGGERLEFLFKDATITAGPSRPGDATWALWVKTREGSDRFADGCPRDHAEWFVRSVAWAREQAERRDKADGHELFTHREAAKRVSELLER